MRLDPVDVANLPLLVQTAGDVPMVVWTDGDGEDVLCPICERSVLLQNVLDGAAYDFAVRCAGCGATSKVPEFPSGRGLSSIRKVVPPGQHASANVEALHGEVVIGEPGVEKRMSETRRNAHPPCPIQLLNEKGIAEIIQHAREVFQEILPGLERRHARRTMRFHRLPQLLAILDENLDAIRSGGREVDVLAVVELHAATVFFGRWFKDPSFSRLLQESKNPTTFNHNVLLLTLASVFEDAGLGPELVPPDGRRSPDLRLRIAAHIVVEVDIKAPVALQRRPGEAISPKDAKAIVGKAITGSRGQFATTSLLVVAGAFWRADFDKHASAAAAALSKDLPDATSSEALQHRRNLCGLILASTTVQLARTRGSEPFQGNWNEVDWSANCDFRWVPNPRYAGNVGLSFSDDLSTFDAQYQT